MRLGSLTVGATVGAAIVMGVAVPAARAAESPSNYPTRPVRMIVPFPPGGGIDIIARAVALKLADTLGQPFVIDNRAGGGGVVGADIAAKAAPDGYTLMVSTGGGFVINPLLISKLPYHPQKDFEPVSLLAVNPTLLVVHPSLPVASVKELIAHAKARPRQLNYASAGNGTPIHLGMELFKWLTGADIVHVPYKGSVPAVTDLLAGQVQVMLNTMPATLPHVRTGKLRALAVGSAKRARAIPEMPTVAESGVPGFEAVTWAGLHAPARTAAAAIAKLNAAVARRLIEPDIVQHLSTQGAEPQPTSPDVFLSYIRDETERARKVIKLAGLKME